MQEQMNNRADILPLQNRDGYFPRAKAAAGAKDMGIYSPLASQLIPMPAPAKRNITILDIKELFTFAQWSELFGE